MKHMIVAAMLVLLPMSASAQVVQSAEVEARIEALMAIVVELQAQLAELLEQEEAETAAKRDAQDRCDDAKEEMADAQEVLAAYAAETKELQSKVGGTRDTAMNYRAKIDWERAPGHKVLYEAMKDASDEVATSCN